MSDYEEMVARARRLIEEQPRHSFDSLFSIVGFEFQDVSDAELEKALHEALGD